MAPKNFMKSFDDVHASPPQVSANTRPNKAYKGVTVDPNVILTAIDKELGGIRQGDGAGKWVLRPDRVAQSPATRGNEFSMVFQVTTDTPSATITLWRSGSLHFDGVDGSAVMKAIGLPA